MDEPTPTAPTPEAEPTPEPAPTAADAERLRAALAALDDDALEVGLRAMSNESRRELAANLQLPPAAARLGGALPALVRRKLQGLRPERQLSAAFALAEACNGETIVALGDRHEDPSEDDMLEVLPGIEARFGPRMVTLMLAGYAASDAPCREVFAHLLDTQERWAVGPPVDAGAPTAAPLGPVTTVSPDPADPAGAAGRAAKREQRKTAKAAKRAAQEDQRAARQAAEAKRRENMHRAKRS